MAGMGRVVFDLEKDILLGCHIATDNVELTVVGVSDRVLAQIGAAREDVVHKPLAAIAALDEDIVDEWIEFILRAVKMPYDDPYVFREGERISSYVLQYPSIFKRWMVVQIAFHQAENEVAIAFIPIEAFPERTLLRQLMALVKLHTLHRHMSKSGHYAIDVPGQRIYLSRSFAKILELENSPAIIPLHEFFQMVHPEDLSNIADALTHIDAPRTAARGRILLPDRRTLYLNTCVAPIFDEEGDLASIFGFAEDITGPERYREKHDHNLRQMVEMTDRAYDLFVVMDAQHRLIHISPGTCELAGRQAEELAGLDIIELLHPDDAARAALEEKRASTDRSGFCRMECDIAGARGEPRRFMLALFPLFDENGARNETIVLGTDITRHRQLLEQNAYLAARDSLTGLYNRKHFWSLLNDISQSRDLSFCLVLLDINGLRIVNNLLGQVQGDRLILRVTEMIREVFCGACDIARIGGDEFAVIVHETDVEQIEIQCARLDAMCEETNLSLLPLSISWGVACALEAPPHAQELFRLSETRMFEHKLIQKRSAHSQSLFSLKEALRSRSMETAEHLTRIEKMLMAFGRRLGLSVHDYNRLILLAALHDVGKLCIPDDIIKKPGALTDHEWAVMRTHSDMGYRIVLKSPEMIGIAQEVLYHHERWDGTGYPVGLKGEKIPLLSQIISVVDSYDVMTHRRVYKQAISHEDAVAELVRCRGTQFSPMAVDLFLDIFLSDEGEAMIREMRLEDTF